MEFSKKVGFKVIYKFKDVEKTGTIASVSSVISIKFEDGTVRDFNEKSFEKGVIRFEDEISQKEYDDEQKRIAEKRDSFLNGIYERARINEEERKRKLTLKERKNHPDDNIVIRAQICDGGTNNYSNWFRGPCSPELREYHVRKDKHETWCKNCSLCKKFVNNECSEQDVINEFERKFLCYECKMLVNHEAKAGCDTENGKIVKHRRWRLGNENLVVLITTEPEKEWKDAIIYSAFLSDQTTKGDDEEEGTTHAIPGCFIDLTIDEARKMRLWDYKPETNGENKMAWGSGLYRYISDDVAARILADMVEIVRERGDAVQTAKAENLLNRFLGSYGGNKHRIPPKCGALIKTANMFDKDYHFEYFHSDVILSNKQVEKKYGVKIEGGINMKKSSDSIVLVTSLDNKKGEKFTYHDHFTAGGDYIFSGRGLSGDQELTGANQNIVDAKKNNKKLYLFIKFSSSEYFFQGEVEYVDYAFEDEKGENGNTRKEIKFTLRRV